MHLKVGEKMEIPKDFSQLDSELIIKKSKPGHDYTSSLLDECGIIFVKIRKSENVITPFFHEHTLSIEVHVTASQSHFCQCAGLQLSQGITCKQTPKIPENATREPRAS